MQCLMGFSVPQHHKFKLDGQKLIRQQMQDQEGLRKHVCFIFMFLLFFLTRRSFMFISVHADACF